MRKHKSIGQLINDILFRLEKKTNKNNAFFFLKQIILIKTSHSYHSNASIAGSSSVSLCVRCPVSTLHKTMLSFSINRSNQVKIYNDYYWLLYYFYEQHFIGSSCLVPITNKLLAVLLSTYYLNQMFTLSLCPLHSTFALRLNADCYNFFCFSNHFAPHKSIIRNG